MKKSIRCLILIYCLWIVNSIAGVEKNGNTWTITESSLTVNFNENTFSVDVTKQGGNKWDMDPNSRSDEIIINDNNYSLSDAHSKEFVEYVSGSNIGVLAKLKNFPGATEVEINIYVYVNSVWHRATCLVKLNR